MRDHGFKPLTPAVDPTNPHVLTLATARGRRLCKVRHADGLVQHYDAARKFDMTAVLVPDLSVLVELLRSLAGRQSTCVLRGAVRDAARSCGVRRLLHPDPASGDVPTLVEVPRSWLAIDMDALPLRPGTDLRDLKLCARLARASLPAVFHASACVSVATAGHGFKDGASLRLWFLLDRPLSGSECKRWLRDAPVDLSIFGAAQPIYTAAPLFRGMADPLPMRMVTLDGVARVEPPPPTVLAPPARCRPRARDLMVPNGSGAGCYAARALARAYAVVATAPVNTGHRTAVTEAWGLARLVARGLISAEQVARALDGALQDAGKPAGEGAKIAAWAVERRAGDAA